MQSGNGGNGAASLPIWEPSGSNTLESLLAFADMPASEFASKGTPWEPGHQIQITGRGGMRSYDKRRVTIARSSYQSHVAGRRDEVIEGDYNLTVDGDHSVSVLSTDSLDVNGDMDWEFHEKLTIMSGTVNRLWHNGVTRYVGMEGIICGGAFSKTFAAGSATICAVASGDVYGGCARVSASRLYIAGMNYRSAEAAIWQTGAYVRNTFVTLEPIIGSPADTKPESGIARMAAKLAMWTCPFLEIGAGVAMFPVGIAMAIKGLVAKKPPKPPSGAPRLRQRTVGVESRSRASEIST